MSNTKNLKYRFPFWIAVFFCLLILVPTTNMKKTIVRNSLDCEKKLIKKTNIMSTLVSCHVIDKSDVSGSTGCVYLIFQFYNV